MLEVTLPTEYNRCNHYPLITPRLSYHKNHSSVSASKLEYFFKGDEALAKKIISTVHDMQSKEKKVNGDAIPHFASS